MRANIRDARPGSGRPGFEALSREFPGAIDAVVGTGLMVSAMLNPSRYRVLGEGGFEEYLRRHGIEMIHGGDTGLRFTPPVRHHPRGGRADRLDRPPGVCSTRR